jgi:2-hydroxychromene-2-carboxylate isomerase
MKHISFYLDFVSPYAYLAFEALPQALQGHSYAVQYQPILFAGLLKHHGQLGPAEIPAKRIWTYRQVAWLARQHGVALRMPAQHPFNPLAWLRLALACSGEGTPNRYVCETIFRQIWQTGLEAAQPEAVQAVQQQLVPALDPDGAAVKARLRANTEAAIAQGVFGVPTLVVDGQTFWGLDALPMLRAYLDGDTALLQEDQQARAVQGYPPRAGV